MADDQAEPQNPEIRGDLKGQASLFPAAPLTKAGARARRLHLRAESPVVDADEAGIDQRFGGRRPGATNIATRQRLELFARISGDPLLAAARVLAMPLTDLAALLGCSPKEAADFQQRERYLAMPYVLSKRPQEISLETKTPPALHLHFPAGATAPSGAAALPGAGGAVALLARYASENGTGLGEVLAPEESDDVSDA